MGTIPTAMYHLCMTGTFLDNITSVMSEVAKDSALCAIILGIVVLLSALTMINMLIGVLCEVMSTVAADEKERMLISFARQKVQEAMMSLDMNHDSLLSRDEFAMLLQNQEAVKALSEVGVDVGGLLNITDSIFQSDAQCQEFDKQLDFDEFMDLTLKLRGVNPATVRDIVDLRQWIHEQNTDRNLLLYRVEERLRDATFDRDRIITRFDEMLQRCQELKKLLPVGKPPAPVNLE